ncbi:MAG: TonB-dependent receptor [Bacteroidota bacterium]
MKFILTILTLCSFSLNVSSESRFIGRIFGTIIDAETLEPLAGVNIYLPALRRGTTTDLHGRYELNDLHEGIYTLRFTFVGYATATHTVSLIDRDVEINMALQASILQLPSITVTGKPQATDILSTVQSTDVLEEHELAKLRGQTIGATLENLPGVSILTTGNGIAKPVIRGLSSQRVVTISDGIRQEGQQWADEHGPEIDVFEAEKIEVVRGPGSLLYGSDALGGVVNVIHPDLPRTISGTPFLESTLGLNAFSNNSHLGGNFGLKGATGWWGYRASISTRSGGNVQTPSGELNNSAASELNGSGTVGFYQPWGFVSTTASRFSTRLEIHEDPNEHPGATPFQKVQHDKIAFHSNVALEGMRLEGTGGWQRNSRREFEEKSAAEPELELVTTTSSFDLKGHHRPLGPVFGTVGASVLSQNVQSLREEKLVPDSKTTDLAGFLYEEVVLGTISFSGGLRYDHRSMTIEESPDLGIIAQNRSYEAVSASLGVAIRVENDLALVGNIATGWRTPTPFELFADGVHEGTASYERGDAALMPERSRSIDVGLRYVSPDLVTQLTIYTNSIAHFIYSSPTGLVDSASTFPVFQFSQADTRFQGLEASVNMQVAPSWQIRVSGDVVTARNNSTGEAIPLIPAHKLILESQIDAESWGPLEHLHGNVKIRLVAKQNRIAPTEARTPGYALLDCSVGFQVPFGQNRLMVHLGVENILDRAYADHLNRFKAFALNPGRNITARVSLPFMVL